MIYPTIASPSIKVPSIMFGIQKSLRLAKIVQRIPKTSLPVCLCFGTASAFASAFHAPTSSVLNTRACTTSPQLQFTKRQRKLRSIPAIIETKKPGVRYVQIIVPRFHRQVADEVVELSKKLLPENCERQFLWVSCRHYYFKRTMTMACLGFELPDGMTGTDFENKLCDRMGDRFFEILYIRKLYVPREKKKKDASS
ncbi:hypothetical protein Q7P37_006321 [Cladosporium fusiforme]